MFKSLKQSFTSAPILCHPNPDLPFIVEVDTSNCGIRAVLSQRQPDSGKLHPCSFFSRKLMPAETNYDMGNRELLSMKAALEEWRHWLEGTHHPFLVLTDHRNLAYFCETKCLNPHQARWALLFTRFKFSVTYQPGSKNGKADALSRIYETLEPAACPELILPPSILVTPVQWDILEEIEQAHSSEAPPLTCPPSKMFVHSSLHQRVIQWTHESLSSGHPGIHRTSQLLRQRFWWLSFSSDVEGYVKSCLAGAQSRTSRHLPEGLLEPLPIPC